MDLGEKIRKIIIDDTKNNLYKKEYREPEIGFAKACDPMFEKLTEIIGNPQASPYELLPDAKTVIVFFIPFAEELVKNMRKCGTVTQMWSDYYMATNRLIMDITNHISNEMEKIGIKYATQPPTYNYDPVALTARWSHKSIAVIAGIGTFGLNHLLITKKGTAGRLGSIVINAEIEPTRRPEKEYCLYYHNGKCHYCLDNCPTGALKEDGTIDKYRCNAYLDGKNIHDDEQGCSVCSSGPCSLKGGWL